MTPTVTKNQRVAVAADHGGRAAAQARARALTSLISRNGAVAVLVLVVVLGALLVPSFGKPDNLRNVALAASFIGIIAAGMTFVIICGGIDLSVGSTYALATIISAMYAPRGSFIAVLYALLAAGLVGLIQGLVIARLRLPAFIVTLAGLTGVRGLVFYITHEGNDHPRIEGRLAFEALGTGSLATIGTPVWIMLAVFAAGWWALNRTPFGQSVQAVGGNQSAAELMGLPVKRTQTIVYVVSGLCAGLSGVLTTALSGGGQEARIGDAYELSAIAAVVIGGTLLRGGVGYVIGTLFGVLILGIIQTLIVFEGTLSSWWTRIAVGALLFVFCLLQRLFEARR